MIPEEALLCPIAIQIHQGVFLHRPQNLPQFPVAILGEGVVRIQKGIIGGILLLKQGQHRIHIRCFGLDGEINMLRQPFNILVGHFFPGAVSVI